MALRSGLLRASSMTRAERARGRFMRAPDHDTAAPPPPPQADPAPADAPASGAGDGGDDTALGGSVEQAPAKEGEGDPPGDKADDVVEAPAGAPDAYELKAPEGMTLDADALGIVEPVLRDLNLPNDAAQKLVDAYSQVLPKVVERLQSDQASAITAQRKAWFEEAKADPEIGGAKWDETIGLSAKALDRLGAPAGSPFRDLLNASGLGNHPEMIRMFAKIGRAVGEDADFLTSPSGRTAKADAAETLYPNDKPKGA